MSRQHGDRGAAAVEFALVAMLLITLVIGIAEFGRAFYIQSVISGAAREGVRAMALKDDKAAAETATVNAASTVSPTVTAAMVSVSPASCEAAPTGTQATVTVTYPLKSMTGLVPLSINLTGKGVMRCNG